MDITVGMMKGGTGKSTTAVHLALALHRATGERVGLIDADPRSQTTTDWRNVAGAEWPDDITVVQWTDPATLGSNAKGLSRDVKHIITDTGGDQPTIFQAALKYSQYLLAPIAATLPEYRRVPATMQVARELAAVFNPKLMSLVTFVKVSGDSDVEARGMREKLTELDIACADTMIPNRKLYHRNFGSSPEDLGKYETLVRELIGYDDEDS